MQALHSITTARSGAVSSAHPEQTSPADALITAVETHDIERVRALARQFPQALREADARDGGLVHRAIRSGTGTSAAMLTTLLAAGADPNRRDAEGYTPLHRASQASHVPWVAAILDRDPDPNLLTPEGRHAIELSNSKECQRLIQETAALGRQMVSLRRHRGPIGFLVWAVDEARRSGYCNLL